MIIPGGRGEEMLEGALQHAPCPQGVDWWVLHHHQRIRDSPPSAIHLGGIRALVHQTLLEAPRLRRAGHVKEAPQEKARPAGRMAAAAHGSGRAPNPHLLIRGQNF